MKKPGQVGQKTKTFGKRHIWVQYQGASLASANCWAPRGSKWDQDGRTPREVMHCALYRSQAGALERRCQAALAVRGHAHCFLLKELKKPSSCRDEGAQGRS